MTPNEVELMSAVFAASRMRGLVVIRLTEIGLQDADLQLQHTNQVPDDWRVVVHGYWGKKEITISRNFALWGRGSILANLISQACESVIERVQEYISLHLNDI